MLKVTSWPTVAREVQPFYLFTLLTVRVGLRWRSLNSQEWRALSHPWWRRAPPEGRARDQEIRPIGSGEHFDRAETGFKIIAAAHSQCPLWVKSRHWIGGR